MSLYRTATPVAVAEAKPPPDSANAPVASNANFPSAVVPTNPSSPPVTPTVKSLAVMLAVTSPATPRTAPAATSNSKSPVASATSATQISSPVPPKCRASSATWIRTEVPPISTARSTAAPVVLSSARMFPVSAAAAKPTSEPSPAASSTYVSAAVATRPKLASAIWTPPVAAPSNAVTSLPTINISPPDSRNDNSPEKLANPSTDKLPLPEEGTRQPNRLEDRAARPHREKPRTSPDNGRAQITPPQPNDIRLAKVAHIAIGQRHPWNLLLRQLRAQHQLRQLTVDWNPLRVAA